MTQGLRQHFDMANNNAWANARLTGACAALSDAEFAAERVGFLSLRTTLRPARDVDRHELDALQEVGRGPAAWDDPSDEAFLDFDRDKDAAQFQAGVER